MNTNNEPELPFRFESPSGTRDADTSLESTITNRPPFASESDARERYSRLQLGDFRSVTLFPGHGHDWPLWDELTGFPVEPAELGLSDALTTRLRRWTDEWFRLANAALDHDIPRDLILDPVWFEEGEDLTQDLAAEMWRFGQVVPLFRGYKATE